MGQKGKKYILEPALPNRNAMQSMYVFLKLLLVTFKK